MPRYTNHLGCSLKECILPTAFLFVLGGFCNLANAYDWGSDYGVNTGVGVHDNYRLTNDDEVNSTSIEFGGFASVEGTTEISRVGLALRAKNRSFSDSSIDDETSYNLSLNTSRTGERLSSYLRMAYDSASTTETELEDTGVNKDGTRNTVTISPGVGYQLDERNSVATDLSYRDVSYDTVSLTDYTNTSLSLSWIYQFDEARSVTTSYVYTVYDPDDPEDPDDDGTTDVNSVNIGYDFSTSEATAYNITLGVANVDGPQDSTTSGTGAFSVVHQADERNIITLALSRSYEGSGDGEVQEEDRINLLLNHALTEKSQVTFSAESFDTDDRNYYTLQTGYNYNYTREVVLSASYQYRRRNEDSFDVDSAHSNTLLFTLLYSPL